MHLDHECCMLHCRLSPLLHKNARLLLIHVSLIYLAVFLCSSLWDWPMSTIPMWVLNLSLQEPICQYYVVYLSGRSLSNRAIGVRYSPSKCSRQKMDSSSEGSFILFTYPSVHWVTGQSGWGTLPLSVRVKRWIDLVKVVLDHLPSNRIIRLYPVRMFA